MSLAQFSELSHLPQLSPILTLSPSSTLSPISMSTLSPISMSTLSHLYLCQLSHLYLCKLSQRLCQLSQISQLSHLSQLSLTYIYVNSLTVYVNSLTYLNSLTYFTLSPISILSPILARTFIFTSRHAQKRAAWLSRVGKEVKCTKGTKLWIPVGGRIPWLEIGRSVPGRPGNTRLWSSWGSWRQTPGCPTSAAPFLQQDNQFEDLKRRLTVLGSGSWHRMEIVKRPKNKTSGQGTGQTSERTLLY